MNICDRGRIDISDSATPQSFVTSKVRKKNGCYFDGELSFKDYKVPVTIVVDVL